MKQLVTIIFLLSSIICFGQNLTGKATYKTFKKSNFKIEDVKGVQDKKMQEQIQARLQKMNQKTYFLTFKNGESLYEQEEKLNAPKPQIGGTVQVISIGGGKNAVLYKNLQDKMYLHQKDIMGKTFLVKDSIKNIEWEVTAETKNIGQYTCYKATFSKEVTKRKIKMINNEMKEEKETTTVTTTAWFTPQVPLSNGPGEYGGLPGLILEINDGTTTIVCTEVVLNPKEEIAINKPKKGKKVNQKEFNKIQKKKSEELMEKMKSRNGIELGNGVKVRLGN